MAVYEALAQGGTKQTFYQWLGYCFEQSGTSFVKPGVLGFDSLAVTQTTTASASVAISAGASMNQDTGSNGPTPLLHTADTVDVLVANPMGSTARNDIVVLDSATTSIHVITGTPNASPSDPSIPPTAIPLARLRLPGNATPITAVTSSMIEDLRVPTNLRRPRKLYRDIAPTASGNLLTGVNVNLGPAQTIPVAPFGPGVPYIVTVDAGCSAECPAGATFFMETTLDGTNVAYPKDENTGTSNRTVDLTSSRSVAVTDPSVTHSVAVILQATGSTVSVNAGASQWWNITIEPYTTF